MQGASRAAAAEGQTALDAALGHDGDRNALADDLFGIAGALDGSAALRRALTDPSREGDVKRGVAERIFHGKLRESALGIVTTLAGQRWTADRDLTDTIASLAVQTVLAAAEREGRADDVEDQLFRFERTVAASPDLRDVLAPRNTDARGKADLVGRLLEGKAAPETVRLVRQAVSQPRGRRLEETLGEYLVLAARRRDEVTAVVTSAVALSEQQTARLSTALEGIYGKSVSIQSIVDPEVLGGIRVQVGDEVVDGTILRRLDEARRHLSGG
ncbi:ATP synthase subunit delta [Nostocoides japonicum T1-X7]|uniref:ATP synthase subunit delta n=1 Tax=Nostocoides japonicum T1-X7 TaxID=1194083 RepID=A0A077LW60_9MICO|nr:F0F1 ATP synthase subunit delta [Tetrasphaera japonica]CCH76224.1 ATP synthase subunit delta [Tetrasphaera japonica T1-X7]